MWRGAGKRVSACRDLEMMQASLAHLCVSFGRLSQRSPAGLRWSGPNIRMDIRQCSAGRPQLRQARKQGAGVGLIAPGEPRVECSRSPQQMQDATFVARREVFQAVGKNRDVEDFHQPNVKFHRLGCDKSRGQNHGVCDGVGMRVLAILAAFCASLVSGAAALADQEVRAVRFGGDEARTRVVVETSSPGEFRAYTLDGVSTGPGQQHRPVR